MNNIELNDLFINARFSKSIKVGFTKDNIEQLLGMRLGKPDVETPDVSWYYFELDSKLIVSLNFDKNEVCYEIKFKFKENKKANFFIRLEQGIEDINEEMPFDHLLNIISNLNISWEFDRKRVYLQTVCVSKWSPYW